MYEILEDIVRYGGIIDLGSFQNSIRENRSAKGFTFVRLSEVN